MCTEYSVTENMRQAGSSALFGELGCQNSPDHIELEDLAQLVWEAMVKANLSTAPQTDIN